MKPNAKIIIASLLTGVMSLSSLAPVVALSISVDEPAVEMSPSVRITAEEKSMETALLAVKEIIEIDTDIFTEFQYNFYESKYYDDTESIGTWNFAWYSDGYKETIYATVLDNGFVLNFDKYVSKSDYNKKLKTITRDQAEKNAGKFIQTLMPDSAKYYKCTDYYTSLESDSLSLVYYAEVNGYILHDLFVKLSIDKFTGEITSISRVIMQMKDYNFVSPDNVINQADAITAYDKKIGLDLVYNYYYDYVKRELKVYPAYQVKSSGKYIDALTGETISVSPNQYEVYTGVAGLAKAEALAEDSGFSLAEKAALESVKNAIPAEKALQTVKDLASKDHDISDVDGDTSLYRHYINKDQYIWNIYIYPKDSIRNAADYFRISASVDAKTGEILSYNYNNYNTYDTKSMDKEKLSADTLKTTAVEIIKTLSSANLGDYIDKTDYENVNDSDYYKLTFYKKVNGVPYLGNTITISVNAVDGVLQSYSRTDLQSNDFPDISAVKSTKEVLNKVTDIIPYNVKYISTEYTDAKKYDTALIYDFKSSISQIDPFTGKFLAFDGSIDETEVGEPDYSDITDAALKKVVDTLIENGVELWNGKFLATKELTEKEFYSIASSFFYTRGIRSYLSNEENVYSDSSIRRKEACKIICRLLGYDDLAKNHKIFANPFGNTIDPEYKGYVAVCNGLNLLHLDNPNNIYNANANLTRADFVYMLYGYIENN